MNEFEIINKLTETPYNLTGLTLGLVGELGSGKTYLVKKLLEAVSDEFSNQVVSPTYSLCCIYQINELTVHHFDLYRIESEDQLYDIDIFGSVGDPNVLTLIEWVDMFPFLQVSCDHVISITVDQKNTRVYSMSKDVS